jgi:DNA-damage-inducible protein J
MKADAVVRARIPADMKERAIATQVKMELSASDFHLS